ncbi:MAG: anti-sigma factor family protein [Phycisphaerae bacterium]
MTTRHDDYQLIQAYLDDEVDAKAAEFVADRIADDPPFAALVQRLASERQVRREAFAAMEAGAPAGRRLAEVKPSPALRIDFETARRWLTTAAAMAACVMLGVLLQHNLGTTAEPGAAGGSGVAGGRSLATGNGFGTSVGLPASVGNAGGVADGEGMLMVPLVDGRGEVVRVLRFENLAAFQAFTAQASEQSPGRRVTPNRPAPQPPEVMWASGSF